MSSGLDMSEVAALAAALAAAPAKVMPAVIPVASKAGVNIKRVANADASGHRYLPGLSRAVEYELSVTPSSVSVEVGFAKRGQEISRRSPHSGRRAPLPSWTSPVA